MVLAPGQPGMVVMRPTMPGMPPQVGELGLCYGPEDPCPPPPHTLAPPATPTSHQPTQMYMMVPSAAPGAFMQPAPMVGSPSGRPGMGPGTMGMPMMGPGGPMGAPPMGEGPQED